MRPVTLRIAVGPAGSDDLKLIQAVSQAFSRKKSDPAFHHPYRRRGSEHRTSRYGRDRSGGRPRRRRKCPTARNPSRSCARTVVVLWSPSGLPRKGSRRREPKAKIKSIDELAGHRIGVVGRSQANVALLRVILKESGVNPRKGGDHPIQLQPDFRHGARSHHRCVYDRRPLDSKITSEPISSARVRASRLSCRWTFPKRSPSAPAL